MTKRAMALLASTAAVAALGAGATAHAGTLTACAATFHVSPGVGSTFVSRIQVGGVTCAKAQFAIGRYEHSLKHTVPFTVAGTTFQCTRTSIQPRSNGVTAISCRHGGQRVSWRSAYGV